MKIESTNKVVFTESEKAFCEDMKDAVRKNENLILHVDEMQGLLKSLTGEEIAPAVWMPYSEINDIPRGTKLWGYYEDGLVRAIFENVVIDGTIHVYTEDPDWESILWDRANQPTHIMHRYDDVKPAPPVKSTYEQIKEICEGEGGWIEKQSEIWKYHNKIWVKAVRKMGIVFDSKKCSPFLDENDYYNLCRHAMKIARK